MTPSTAGFDRLAPAYRALEFLAFGRDLERARFCLVPHLAGRSRILVLGEGDGRFLARLVEADPQAEIHCIDSSPAMLVLASARASGAGAGSRVTFEQADVLTEALGSRKYDAVATLFFLDCFTPGQVGAIASKVRPSLADGARWVFADFALPPRGILRWRARAWLRILYLFFRWGTTLAARSLPPSEEILLGSGFRRSVVGEFQGGLVRSVVFDLPRSGPD